MYLTPDFLRFDDPGARRTFAAAARARLATAGRRLVGATGHTIPARNERRTDTSDNARAETVGAIAPARRGPAAAAETSLLMRAQCAFRQYLRQRRDYKRLLDQPDYLLDDIGLTRAELRAARPGLLF